MSETKYCPCCGRHCDLKEPHCGRGEEYLRTGVIPERRHFHGRPENYKSMDMDNKLIINLRNMGHMIRFLFEGKGSQKRILIILRETGGMTQRELTERIGVQPGSASEVIGKLESAGLIERTPSQTDRRTTEIKLTESGRIKADEAAQQRKTRHQEMFSCLSAEEKNILLELAEKINADWDSRYRDNDREFGHCGRRGKNHGSHGHHNHHGHHGDLDSN